MKTKRFLCLLLTVAMLVTSLVSGLAVTTAAEETGDETVTAVPNAYVKNGLVALYSGTQNTREGHDTSSTVWQDLVSGYDVNVTTNANNYFTEDGLHLKAAQNSFPQGVVDVVNGSAFTVEIYMTDLVSTADAYSTIMNSSNDNFALFRRISSDVLEFKFAGNAAGSRNTVTDCLNLLQDALITITYEVGGESRIYINGELMSAKDSPSAMGAGDLFFGHTEEHRHFEAIFHSMRFYNRALTTEEILHNCVVDGIGEVTDLYVTDGLVSLYSGIQNTADGQDNAATVWADLVGDNDMAITTSAKSYFTGEGLYVNSVQHNFPQPIVDLVNSDEFTVEIQLGDFTSIGADFNTFLNSTNDNFALFRRVSTDQLELKWAAKAADSRPKINDGLNTIDNSVISITYKVGGYCRIYVNGLLCGEVSCDATMDADDLFIGHTGATKLFASTYRAIRFYNRELTAEEVLSNAKYDGAIISEAAQVINPGYVTVAQPQTNIVGDIALVREINTASELTKLTSAEQKPAVAIYTINENLEVLSEKGASISTVTDVLMATEYKVLSAFRVNSTAAANALVAFLKEIRFYDCFIISADPTIVKAARTELSTISGVIDYTETYKDATELTEEQCLDIRRSMKINNGTIAILPAALCDTDTVQYLYNRQVNVWVKAADAPSEKAQYDALLSGAIGVISDATDSLLDIACNKLPANTMTRVTLNIGHRGIPSTTPENTLEGSIEAYEQGADVIELDIYLTTDGEIVIMHDGTTSRTCNGDLTVEASTLAQLKELYVNKGFENSEKYSQCRIPTLREYLEYFKGKDCNLFIEIKSSNTAIVAATKKLVDEYDMYGQCSVITFHENIMAAMRTDYPEMSVGALCGGYMAGSDPESDLRAAMSFIGKYNATLNPSYGGFEANDIRAALLRGISIYPWTFQGNLSAYQNHLLWGYSGLTGNNANVLKKLAKDVSFTSESTEYTIGSSLPLTLAVTYYNHDTKDSDATITILSGADCVNVTDSAIEFIKAGDVTFILSYTQLVTRTDNYVLHTQPITITVKSDEDPTQPPDTSAGGDVTTEPTTDEPIGEDTTVPTEDATLPTDTTEGENGGEQSKGCGSTIGGATVLLLAAGAAVLVRKKKENE